MSLVATAVTASYGPRIVLRDCTFRIGSGEVVAVVGPNGAGKSTLLRVLAGLLRPAAGTVALDGRDVSTLSRSTVARPRCPP
jgi:ABC-type cobalamin/Fe3+-siderophores transport system ATPase subunit